MQMEARPNTEDLARTSEQYVDLRRDALGKPKASHP